MTPLIGHLLGPRRPSAVLRRVRAIVVDAIQAARWWPRSHVAQERGEVAPLVTDRDVAPAVVSIARIARVGAALNHARPRLVGARALAAGFAVCTSESEAITPAALRVTGAEMSAGYVNPTTAGAHALPHSLAGAPWCSVEHGKAAELLAGEVDESGAPATLNGAVMQTEARHADLHSAGASAQPHSGAAMVLDASEDREATEGLMRDIEKRSRHAKLYHKDRVVVRYRRG